MPEKSTSVDKKAEAVSDSRPNEKAEKTEESKPVEKKEGEEAIHDETEPDQAQDKKTDKPADKPAANQTDVKDNKGDAANLNKAPSMADATKVGSTQNISAADKKDTNAPAQKTESKPAQ